MEFTLDPKIERTLHQLRRENKQKEEMEEENNNLIPNAPGQMPNAVRAIRDCTVPTFAGCAIRPPTIQTNNFKLKPALIQMVQSKQFVGYPNESPDEHLAIFLRYCNTIKMNNVTPYIIMLQLFPFSLRDKAGAWFNSLPQESITTWAELSAKFLRRFFPPARTAKLRSDITNFTKFSGESL